ncbi:MAG: hypothetical protein NZM37_02035 [Sandaracinaceae bacterium]|nr:hypothetical protein [Sandaracinaceae bacterium]
MRNDEFKKWLGEVGGPWVVRIAQWTVGLVFLVAAIPKLADPAAFAKDVMRYHLLPEDFVGLFALSLPPVEAVVGAALLVGWRPRGAALVAMSLLVIFTVALLQAIFRGIDIECGCFGKVMETRVGWGAVVRNLLLFVGAGVVALSRDGSHWSMIALSKGLRRRLDGEKAS